MSDGKVIAKEMRYAKENEFMERDGSKEDETDWDSLSDRVKKNRRQFQKAVRGEFYMICVHKCEKLFLMHFRLFLFNFMFMFMQLVKNLQNAKTL